MKIVKSPPQTIDNSMWTQCFLHFCNYKQSENNDAMRRVFLRHAREAEIMVDPSANPESAYMRHMESLGEPKTNDRANALIRMLEYNYPAAAYGPGWINNRESDIEFIKSKWLN